VVARRPLVRSPQAIIRGIATHADPRVRAHSAVSARPMPDVPGVEHRFIDAGGLRVHVAQAGAGEPVVMLHGWPQNWFAYRRVIPALAEHYRVICPDLRGFGWTEATPGGYRKRQLVADLFSLLDALELDEVRLVGHDWGSIVGFLACIERPERFARYLVLGGWSPWPKVDLKAAVAFSRFWYQAVVATPVLAPRYAVGSPAFMRLLYRVWSGNSDLWSDAELDALLGQFDEPARRQATSLMYRTWLTRELGPMIARTYISGRLDTPTLYLHGGADGCIDPAFARCAAHHAPNMTVEILPGIGHFVPEEAPDVVVARALELFA
jgi:pimeloyl-ACP methyl ester carboxylesterase